MKPPFFAGLTETLGEAVKHFVRYESKDENGETRAERNARFSMSHLTPPEPDIPECVAHVWEWFWQLSNKRRSGMNGAESLSFSDIGFWAKLVGSEPMPEEVRVILALDDAYLSAVREEQQAKQKSQQGKKR